MDANLPRIQTRVRIPDDKHRCGEFSLQKKGVLFVDDPLSWDGLLPCYRSALNGRR